jgi:hypothetical protein
MRNVENMVGSHKFTLFSSEGSQPLSANAEDNSKQESYHGGMK